MITNSHIMSAVQLFKWKWCNLISFVFFISIRNDWFWINFTFSTAYFVIMTKHIVLIVYFTRPYIIVVKIVQALGSHTYVWIPTLQLTSCAEWWKWYLAIYQSVTDNSGLNYVIHMKPSEKCLSHNCSVILASIIIIVNILQKLGGKSHNSKFMYISMYIFTWIYTIKQYRRKRVYNWVKYTLPV